MARDPYAVACQYAGHGSAIIPLEIYPAHGYVRNQQWRLVSSVDTDDATIVRLRPCAIQNAMNEDGLELELSITVGRQLTLALSTRNTSDRPRNYGAALHSYFEISDIHNTCLKGLSGAMPRQN